MSEIGAPSPVRPGTMVDHFRILRPLGRGGMGEVHLARDIRLGRRVAIKVLRSDILGSQTAVERFLAEARNTARFSHPHIVAIHHVGEVDGNPYLALEYLEGRSLRDRMREEQAPVAEAIRVGRAIAEALAEAHRHGVLHRDLKPENVMLPRDGRLRVVDFGLARTVDGVVELETEGLTRAERDELARSTEETAHEGIRGSPAYMSPEQWREEEATPATDLWALGVLLFEMVHGHHPYEGADTMQLCHRVGGGGPAPKVRAAVPAPLKRLIERCMDKQPGGRPTAEEAVRELGALLDRGPGRAGAEVPPFRGLLPFDERHAQQFHGRDDEVAAFLERLRVDAVLPVVGPSGAGKSSFVLAGVVPRLREQGRWIVLKMRPGRHPLRVLAARLKEGARADESVETTHLSGEGPVLPEGFSLTEADAGDPELDAAAARLEEELRSAPARLALRLVELAERERRAGEPARVLLFVDQLEELFTLVDDEAMRRTVLDAICAAADDPRGPVRVIFTVRADFLGHLTASRAAREALGQVTVLGPPGRRALAAIMRSLVVDSGYAYDDPSLVDEMVEEVAGEEAALPLLQFAGQMLWNRRDRDRRLLRRADHDELGGVAGALAHHADGMLAGLSASQLRSARAILLALVTEQGTRRVLRYGDLPWDALGRGSYEVLDRLVRGRLVSVIGDRGVGGTRSGTDGAEIELVHESLIQSWGRLRTWLEESREERVFVHEVAQAAELWHRRGERDEELWSGDALADAWRTRARFDAVLPDRARIFLERAHGLQRRRVQRRRLAWGASIAASLAVALLMGVLALEARRQEAAAEAGRQQAEEGRAVAQREAARAALAQGNPLEARAKLRSSLETLDSVDARALWWQLRAEPLQWREELGGGVSQLDGSPDGRRIAAAAADGTIHLFDLHTGRDTILRGHEDDVREVTFAAGGTRLVSGTYRGDVGFWDVEAAREVAIHRAHESYVIGLAVSPDGARVATGAWDGSIRVWDAIAGEPLASIPAREPPSLGLAFTPDGGQLISGAADGSAVVWDAVTGARVATLAGHGDVIHDLTLSPDGRQLATASWDGTARLWDWQLGTTEVVLEGHTDRLVGVAYQPAGELIATASVDGTVRVWARDGGEPRWVFPGHGSRDPRIRFSADGRLLAARADDRTVRVYDLGRDGRERVLRGHGAAIVSLAFLADGRHLVSGDYEQGLHLWRIEPEIEPIPSRGHGAAVSTVAVSPQGDRAVSAGADRSIRIWDVPSGRERGVLGTLDDGALVARFGVDGRVVAAAGLDSRIHVWDASSRQKLAELVGHLGPIHDLAFHPDGETLVSVSADGDVRRWDLARGRTLQLLAGHDAYLVGLAISPDGQAMLTTGADGSLGLWRAEPFWHLSTLARPSRMALWGVAFLGDGERFVTGGDDRALHVGHVDRPEGAEALPATDRILYPAVHPDGERLGVPLDNGLAWVGRDGERTMLRGHRASVSSVAFTADGATVLTSSEDGTVRAWDVDRGVPRWRTTGLLPSPPEIHTHLGWQRLDDPGAAVAESAAWRLRVAGGARAVAAAPGRTSLCLLGGDGRLELWDPAGGQPLASWPGAEIVELQAAADGCLARDADGTVARYTPSGDVVVLAHDVVVMAADGAAAVLAVDREVRAVDPAGEVAWQVPGEVGITAVGRVGEALAVGFREGTVQLVDPGDDGEPSRVPLTDVPAAAATRLVAGAPGTLAAGFADGTFGLWSAADGSPLLRAKLHGPVVHLLYEGAALYAATELGDHARLDLGVLDEDYCTLMRALWAEVPVVWSAGRARDREPDPSHACANP